MTRSLLVVGHSHVGPIRDAARVRREADPDRPRTRTVYMLDPRLLADDDGILPRDGFPAGVLAEMRRQIDRHAPLVASTLGGNVHCVMSLLRDDRPFDFVLDGEPSPRLDPTAEILPVAEIRARLAEAMAEDLERLTILQREIGFFWQVESPPPVAAGSFILRRMEEYFERHPHRANGVSPGGLRYRMWRLACRITREHCRRIGAGYVATPAAVRDEQGFLRREFAHNATHGNTAYGEIMIRTLEAIGRRGWRARVGPALARLLPP